MQSELSLWTRDRLDDVLPWCAARRRLPPVLAARPRLPDRHGRHIESFDDRDFRASNPRFTREAMAANLAIVDQSAPSPAARRHAGAGRAGVGAGAGRARRPDPGHQARRAPRGERGGRRAGARPRTSPSSTRPPPVGARY